MSNLTESPGTGDNVKAVIEKFKREIDDQKELMSLIAQMTRAKYDALIEEGFTAEQALELCKKIP